MQWLFFGLKAAVLAVVVEAVIRIGKRALKNRVMVALAALAFIGIFFFDVPFPLIVLSAAIVGYAGGRIRPDVFSTARVTAAKADPCDGPAVDRMLEAGRRATPGRPPGAPLRVAAVWLLVWSAPFALILWFQGADGVYFQIAAFFSKAAVVTFGGAYAVLAYAAQQAVETFGWMQPHEMLDGLGMAETTPGPLIMVLQFVGFMAAFRNPGGLDPLGPAPSAPLLPPGSRSRPASLDLSGRALHRSAARQPESLGRALGHYGGGGGSRAEPGGMVHRQHHLRQGQRRLCAGHAPARAGVEHAEPAVPGHRGIRRARHLPLEALHAQDHRGERRPGVAYHLARLASHIMAGIDRGWDQLKTVVAAFGYLAGPALSIQPPRARRAIELRHVGLDVQEGCTVQDVDVRHVQAASLDASEPDEGHADRVGPVGRTGGEQAAGLGVQVRDDRQRVRPRPVKMV